MEHDYDWYDNSLPFFDIYDADMCEALYPVDVADIYNQVALFVIKFRLIALLASFQGYTTSIFQATTVPSSPFFRLRGNQGVLLTVFSFLRPDFPCFKNRPLFPLMDRLWDLLADIVDNVHTCFNKHLWRLLAYPSELDTIAVPQGAPARGSLEEAVAVAKAYMEHIFDDSDEGGKMMRKMLRDDVEWVSKFGV